MLDTRWDYRPPTLLCSYDTDTGNNGTDMGGGQGDVGTTGGNGGFGGNNNDTALGTGIGFDGAPNLGGITSAMSMGAIALGLAAQPDLAAVAGFTSAAVAFGAAMVGITAVSIETTLSHDPTIAAAQLESLGAYGTTAQDFATTAIATEDWAAAGFAPWAVASETPRGNMEVLYGYSGQVLAIEPSGAAIYGGAALSHDGTG